MINDDMINKLSKYVGIPCVHGENSSNGMSCLALAHNVLSEFGIDTPAMKYIDMPEDWWKLYPDLIEQELLKMGVEVFDINKLQATDVLLFSMVDNCDVVTHIGVMVDDTKFIHALINTRSKISKINSKLWRDKLKRIVRVR